MRQEQEQRVWSLSSALLPSLAAPSLAQQLSWAPLLSWQAQYRQWSLVDRPCLLLLVPRIWLGQPQLAWLGHLSPLLAFPLLEDPLLAVPQAWVPVLALLLLWLGQVWPSWNQRVPWNPPL